MYYLFKKTKFHFKSNTKILLCPPSLARAGEGVYLTILLPSLQLLPRVGQCYLSVSIGGPKAGHAGIHGLVPGQQERLREVHQLHQDSRGRDRNGRAERYQVGMRTSSAQPCPSLPRHLSTVKCRALLLAEVSRLRISARKGWGCSWSCSRHGLTSFSRGASELRACSRSTRSFPSGPKNSTRCCRAGLAL